MSKTKKGKNKKQSTNTQTENVNSTEQSIETKITESKTIETAESIPATETIQVAAYLTKPTKKSTSSHKMDGKYAILMETNGKEYESWYYFIRKDGNEEALQHLHKQLESIEWYIIDELSTFDLDMTHLVSATTAKEMSKAELNATSFHRKFDGKLEKIDFGFRKKDNNEVKICKVFDLLGYGQISDFIDDEDIDDEDLLTSDSDDSDSDTSETSSSDSGSSKSDSSDSAYTSSSEEEKTKSKLKSNTKNKTKSKK